MSATLKAKTLKRHRRDRFHSTVDWLEERVVLSTTTGSGVSAAIAPFDATNPLPPTLSLAGLDPTFGTTVTDASVSITVRFDRPIDPGSLVSDFEINQVDAGGNLTPIENLGIFINETLGNDGQSIIITTTQPLAPGAYNVVLLGSGGVTGLDGSSIMPVDTTLGTFAVATPDVGLSDAVDLGMPGDKAISASDQIDPATPFSDVRLYKIELPATHKTWRLGLEVYAGRIGSGLQSTLGLFDGKGNVIATSQVGRSDSPQDPFLFDGIRPGVYYIGVSAAGNVPGTPGGYDPVKQLAGHAPAGVAGGAFKLDVVADSADTPTSVKTFFLDYADLLSPTPTGFTLQFSGPMNEVMLSQANTTAVKVLDAHGGIWTAHSTRFDESTSTAVFQFDKILPQGSYSVLLGRAGQLVNLANQAPVSPGYAAGILAMFQVGPTIGRIDPLNFGPLPVDVATHGVSASPDLAANQSVTYRAVILGPGIYDLQTKWTGSAPTISVNYDGKPHTIEAGRPGVLNRHDFSPAPGVFTLTITAGSAPVHIDFLLKQTTSLQDQLLINGVGQASALSLRLIDPSAISAGLAPSAGGGYGPATGIAGIPNPISSGAGSGGSSSGAIGSAMSVSIGPAVPSTSSSPGSTLLISPSGTLIGHPSTLNEQVSVVGPISPSGQSALAYNGTGLPLGLNGRPNGLDRAGKALINGEMFAETLPNQTELAASGPEVALSELNPDTSEQLPMDDSLLGRVAGIVARMFPGEKSGQAVEATADLDHNSLAQLDPSRPAAGANPPAEEVVETADLSHSAGIGIVAMAAVVLHRKARRWIERRRNRITAKLTTN